MLVACTSDAISNGSMLILMLCNNLLVCFRFAYSTYAYMPTEYYMLGHVSEKTDR